MTERSLDLLPPELLRQIIEFSIPFTYHSNTYRARQDNLRSLSFTSRNFRPLAQSLLCEIIYVRSKKSLDSTMDLLKSRGSGVAVRQAIIKCSFDDDFNAATIERVCTVFPNLVTLTLDVWPLKPLDLSYLNRLPCKSTCLQSRDHCLTVLGSADLKDLRLSSECFAMIEPNPLPNLRFLTIYNVNIREARTLLDPTLLPSLQALALPGITEAEDWVPLLKSNNSSAYSLNSTKSLSMTILSSFLTTSENFSFLVPSSIVSSTLSPKPSRPSSLLLTFVSATLDGLPIASNLQ